MKAIGVHFLDLDSRIEEQMICNIDGINEGQMLAYQHALLHIVNDDFNK